ncbi:translation initiation factor IF-2-like [Triticum urartu]|uniref:translation initiation factor IF-2-like n=1 Tax=Triticum urartu TaxID=4572 RepID=UPI0020445444|nr:translation initiation factor IF-2-like [Triticum urartu]
MKKQSPPLPRPPATARPAAPLPGAPRTNASSTPAQGVCFTDAPSSPSIPPPPNPRVFFPPQMEEVEARAPFLHHTVGCRGIVPQDAAAARRDAATGPIYRSPATRTRRHRALGHRRPRLLLLVVAPASPAQREHAYSCGPARLRPPSAQRIAPASQAKQRGGGQEPDAQRASAQG